MADRRHWLFQLPCGCNEAVTTVEHYPTRTKAWNSVYDTSTDREGALKRGVTVKEITHEEWVNEHMARHGRCTHG